VLREGFREVVPLDWAATRNDLGSALWHCESGIRRLGEAESAYREGHNTNPPELLELVDAKRTRLVLFSLPIPPINNANVPTHPADEEI
jgi:hypothetical protein